MPRAWLVLSESAKAKGVDSILGAIEEFLRDRLSDQHWLHGGFEVIEEVLPQFAPLHRRSTDVELDTQITVWEGTTPSAATRTREPGGEENPRASETVISIA